MTQVLLTPSKKWCRFQTFLAVSFLFQRADMSILTSFSLHLLSAGDATPGLDPPVRELWMYWRESNRGWPRGGSRGSYSCLQSAKTEPSSLKQCPVTGPEILGTNWNTGGAIWVRKYLFTMGVTYYRLSREVVGSRAMDIFKSHQDTVLDISPCSSVGVWLDGLSTLVI